MTEVLLPSLTALVVGGGLFHLARRRLQLSRAKHPSLTGHVRMARRVAGLLPGYAFNEDEFFQADDAPAAVVERRRAGFQALVEHFVQTHPVSAAMSASAAGYISDLQFTRAYRVPFQFSRHVRRHLKIGGFVESSEGVTLTDMDGQRLIDVTGSYGVNVLGHDFYRECMGEAVRRADRIGLVLGSLHPATAWNAQRLCRISGKDEVSFHMSGTEAVMQAVRLARYHTRKKYLVRFCGAYHGWWDDVQPGPGNPMPPHKTYTLREMHPATLRVLRTRNDIACVLVNPLQALHPNSPAPGDSTLVDGSRRAAYDRAAYTRWLQELREVCTLRGIVLIFDEVFLGFRLAPGGAQEHFGVQADIVTYGKTLGGGFPVGVVCGRSDLMRRFREDHPADICFARGTFNSHPYVMTAMQVFLEHLDKPATRELYRDLDVRWDARARELNAQLTAAKLPVLVANLSTVWTVLYTSPSRYHWMFQFYLRAQGIALSWVGSGRMIFSLDFTDADFDRFSERFIRAAESMRNDGWWHPSPTLTHKGIRRRILWEILDRMGKP
jgi:glutamate-1-semialdehyde 2,1-aminomutase